MNFVKMALCFFALSCARSYGMQQSHVLQQVEYEARQFELLVKHHVERFHRMVLFPDAKIEMAYSPDKTTVTFNYGDRVYIYTKNDKGIYTKNDKLRFFHHAEEERIKNVAISSDGTLLVGTVEHWENTITDESDLYFFVYHVADKSYALVLLFNDETISCKAITKKSIFIGPPDESKIRIVPRDLKKNVLFWDLPLYKKSKSIMSKFVRSGRKGIDKFINLYVDTSKKEFDF